ncbi:Hpt domain-containing protein [Paracoccus panacisoli]|uniref:Hpt domain-containing protein n=1 Tax=Paracoccus panacisoli TaxID=1510163 RepID=A0ABV6T2Y6_9RHOB
MIDWKRMAALRHEVGEDEFAPLVELFLDEIEGAIMTMVPNDPDRMEQRLHFLKGCGLNMGLNAFCRLCDTWERMVATGLGDQLDVEALMAGYAASKQALMRDLEAMTAPPTDAAGREGAA